MEQAILLTAGLLDHPDAKTAHGLLRASSRYHITGLIDHLFAGTATGGIGIFGSVSEFLARSGTSAACAIVGIAVPGGRLPERLLEDIKEAIKAGLSIVSGLHDYLVDIPELAALAAEHRVTLLDIRRQRPKDQLKFWKGEILEVKCPVIAVLGTDCAIGKRTTAVMLTAAAREQGLNAQMVYTGQTGWLQGHSYGFILDSTCNDFISGELENAVVTCYRETSPDVIFVEGQSALCNPSGPCGAELLLSAQCKGVILQHAPAKVYYKGQEHTQLKISLERELEMIRLYDSRVLAITLNTSGLNEQQALQYKSAFEQQYPIPVILPLEEGVSQLVKIVQNYLSS
jgi:uncharacterized NAD-dependent epimerase/dehydratase family protein